MERVLMSAEDPRIIDRERFKKLAGLIDEKITRGRALVDSASSMRWTVTELICGRPSTTWHYEKDEALDYAAGMAMENLFPEDPEEPTPEKERESKRQAFRDELEVDECIKDDAYEIWIHQSGNPSILPT